MNWCIFKFKFVGFLSLVFDDLDFDVMMCFLLLWDIVFFWDGVKVYELWIQWFVDGSLWYLLVLVVW